MSIRERVAEFDSLTKAHPDERYLCLSVAADRHDLLVAGDALIRAAERAEALMGGEHDGCEDAGQCFNIGHSEARHDLGRAIETWKTAAS